MSLSSAGNSPAIGNPKRFHRSNTTVSDYDVVIGERYFPLHDVLRAEVIDMHPAPPMPPQAMRARRIGFGILAALYIVTFVFDLGTFGSILRIAALGVLFLVLYTILPKEPKNPEYRLVLHTSEGSEEVLTAREHVYLLRIAKEINGRANRASLPDELRG